MGINFLGKPKSGCQENNNSSDFIKIKYFCKIRYSKIKKKTVKIKQQTEIKCLQHFHQRFRTQNVRRACRTTTMATKGRERKQERERKNKEWAKKKKNTSREFIKEPLIGHKPPLNQLSLEQSASLHICF